jgi:hypothetical protein
MAGNNLGKEDILVLIFILFVCLAAYGNKTGRNLQLNLVFFYFSLHADDKIVVCLCIFTAILSNSNENKNMSEIF